MARITWASIAEQLRSIGVDVSLGEPLAPEGSSPARSSTEILPTQPTERDADIRRAGMVRNSCQIDSQLGSLCDLLKPATAAGVMFFERVVDGKLVAEGLSHLPPDLLQALSARWDEICSELLPAVSGSGSTDLLANAGIDLIVVDDELLAAEEVARICGLKRTIGLDIETAPRPEFLPTRWPIKITKDGQRSKIQNTMDTSAALDPFRAEVRLLQVAAEIGGRVVALVFDLRHVPLASPSLAPLWRCRLVGHNVSFDAKMLLANRIEIPAENLVDTMLMSGLVLRGVADTRREGSRRPPLAEAVKEAFGLELPKQSQVSPWWRDRLTEEQIAYAALDAVMSLRLATALQPRLDRLPVGPDSERLVDRLCRAVMPVARMELTGVALNRDELAKQADAWSQDLETLSAQIAKLGIVNPSSPAQIASWLCRELHRVDDVDGTSLLSAWPRTGSGELSTKAKHLRRLLDVLPETALLVRYSVLAQLQSNFGDKLINRISAQTGRLHGSFLIAAAKSGRFSSANPNLQNIPKSKAVRSVFSATPGKTLVVADYSQLELRVMAEIAKDQVMTEAYRNGLDLHAVTAAGMMDLKPQEFDAENLIHKEARQKAKAVNFGVIYGSGPGGLRKLARDEYNLQITIEEARSVIDRFLATYPGVARWQREQENRSRQTMTASTAGGRIYRFAWEPRGEYSRNLALNLPIQGTAAEIAIEALIRIDVRLRASLPGKAQLVLQVHDEFVVEVEGDEAVVLATKSIVEQEMIAAFEALLPGAPTKGLVTAHFGPTWAAAKR
jgi:DNA polymerase I